MLKLYKFNKDTAILGTLQLDTLVEQDEKISVELKAIEVTGTKIKKHYSNTSKQYSSICRTNIPSSAK